MISSLEDDPTESATRTILIVDDDRSVADTFARILKLEGFEVATAMSAEAGMEIADSVAPDAIILDIAGCAAPRSTSRRSPAPSPICRPIRRASTGREAPGKASILFASIGNGRRVGGAFLLTPDARNDDGMLDICFTPEISLLRLLRILPRAFRGTHVRKRPVQLQRGARIRIESQSGFPVHIDGEVIGLDIKGLDLRVAPQALRTF